MPAVRFDTTSWLPGALLFGDDGFGVVGALIPAAGLNGPAYAYPSLSLPADSAAEICGRITAEPSAGIFSRTEDTSFAFTAPDGTYTAQFQLYVDGVLTGASATITLKVGVVASGQGDQLGHHHPRSQLKYQEYSDFVDKLVADEASDLEDAEFAEVISILHAVGALQ